MADWTKTGLTLWYHWRTALVWGLGGFAALAVILWGGWPPTSATASPLEWSSGCAAWNEEWFHNRTTRQHIHYCVTQNRVQVNQTDHEGRTLLLRIARDFVGQRRRKTARLPVWPHEYESTGRLRYQTFEQASRSELLALVRTMMYWKDEWGLDLNATDRKGRTALRYAVKKVRGASLAAVLLKAGASLDPTVTERDKEKSETHWIPVLDVAHGRIADPFMGEVSAQDLAACQTADCLIEEVVKDAD